MCQEPGETSRFGLLGCVLVALFVVIVFVLVFGVDPSTLFGRK